MHAGGAALQDAVQGMSRSAGKPSKNNPAVDRAIQGLSGGVLTQQEYSDAIRETVSPYDSVPLPATVKDMYKALASNKKDKLGGSVPEGASVGLRLDIPAYQDHGVWVPTLHGNGIPTSHRATAALTNANLEMPEALKNKARKIREGASKSPFARIEGNFVNRTDEENFNIAKNALDDPEWTQIGYDPRRQDFFYDRADASQEVLGADEIVQVGPLVMGRNVRFRKELQPAISDIAKKYGIAIPAAAAMLARQMGLNPEDMYEEDEA